MIAPGTVERAFQLARSGRFRTVDEIIRVLIKENYVSAAQHLAGRSIRKQLLTIAVSSADGLGELRSK